MYKREPFLSTDGELVKFANLLIRRDENFEEELEYNGNFYKISIRKEETFYGEVKKDLTISKDSKSLVITFLEKKEDNIVSSSTVTNLSFELNDSNGNKSFYLKHPLKSVDKFFSVNDFRDISRFRFRFNKDNTTSISCSFDKKLSFAKDCHNSNNRFSTGEYRIHPSFIEYNEYLWQYTHVEYYSDGKKIKRLETSRDKVLNDNNSFVKNRLSTWEDLNKFDPHKECELIFQEKVESYPHYYYKIVKQMLSEYLEPLLIKIKESTKAFYKEYMVEVQDVLDLRNTFLGELREDESGKYLYFSKNELRYLYGYVSKKGNAKTGAKIKEKSRNEIKQQ